MKNKTLNAALLKAHEEKDGAGLVKLYTQAANESEAQGDEDRACFFLTHAYIFALELGVPEAKTLNARLAHRGREVLQAF